MPKKLKVFVPPHKRIPANNRQRCGDPFYSHKAWRAVRAAVLVRDEYTCKICGVAMFGDNATVDHVKARASGGDEYDMGNLQAACRRCNSRKGDR
jgi:5-methylcytosine-specific restriction endonuclease McrA